MCVAVLVAVPILCGRELVVVTGRAMGTTWTAKFVPAANSPKLEAVRTRSTERLEELEQIFSSYRPGSTVSRFTASRETDWQPVDAELVDVVRRGAAVSEMTRGAFDPTVAPLVARWGFGPSGTPAQLPTEGELKNLRQHVGWRKIAVRDEPPALRKDDAEVGIDVSSMAKGYAADQLSTLLGLLGTRNHLVQLGGDVRAAGEGPEGNGWNVGIENPIADGPRHSAVVRLVNGNALSTSGNYRNVIARGGRRVGHIIDPRSGQPVDSHVIAVSVIHPTCAMSSALATGLFVMGVEEGLRLAVEQRLAVSFLLRDGDQVARKATPEFEMLGK